MDAERILRNVALAYIGAVAFAYEKTKDAVDFCIEKGAKTVEELRPRGEELVGKIKQTVENKAYGRDAKINVMLSLMNEQERELIKQLAALPDEMLHAAQSLDPSRINRYAMELAARFHRFYNACRIRGAEPGTLEARLLLADCSRSAIALCLSTLGVHAPEQM